MHSKIIQNKDYIIMAAFGIGVAFILELLPNYTTLLNLEYNVKYVYGGIIAAAALLYFNLNMQKPQQHNQRNYGQNFYPQPVYVQQQPQQQYPQYPQQYQQPLPQAPEYVDFPPAPPANLMPRQPLPPQEPKRNPFNKLPPRTKEQREKELAEKQKPENVVETDSEVPTERDDMLSKVNELIQKRNTDEFHRKF